ncbi:glycosyltransferase family 2 protein [Bacillus sp. V59.32b]|uniref:glycosyltransferase family 2 protein n=1 Tax=Bacillus sp. V59.32b TaxID=1758642 RepID=UPI001358DA2D|nr:glycosyltransferase family 2 protein [Bacillus sp. V59.32b]
MSEDYELWLKYNTLTNQQKEDIRTRISQLKARPLFSIITVVQKESIEEVKRSLQSVLKQLYTDFEVILVISSKNSMINAIKEFIKDSRLKIHTVRKENSAELKNAALEEAAGDYMALLEPGDILSEHALFENAAIINKHRDAALIYSDEDQINNEGKRHSPFFKPGWSPDTFLAQRYSLNLCVYKTAAVRKINGFHKQYKGIENSELALRLSEVSDKIYHIPKILYHKREASFSKKLKQKLLIPQSIKAVEEALTRRQETATVKKIQKSSQTFLVHYQTKTNPMISIIIPTRDKADLLDTCLQSIFDQTTYSNFEIIVVDNGSVEEETFAVFEKWKASQGKKMSIVKMDIPYNWSTINNQAVKQAKGELILLLNNDIEILSPDWLQEMAGQAMRRDIGAVGVKLLYPDKTIQHAGVIMGIHGVSDHCYKGKPHDFSGYFNRLLAVSNFSAVTGACLMVKKSLYEAIGGMDENLAIEFNDVDFCLRLLDKGYFNVLLPQVVLLHHESKSRGQSNDAKRRSISQKEAAILKGRWRNIIEEDPFYNRNLDLSSGNFEVEYRLNRLMELNELAGKVIDSDETILGRINGTHNGGKLELFGWAINQSKKSSRMQVFVANQDDLVVAHTKVNRERKDISAKFNDESFLESGWWTVCDTSLLPEGKHILYAYAFIPDEKKAIRLKGEFPITI